MKSSHIFFPIILFVVILSSSAVNGVVHLKPVMVKSPGDLSYVLGSTGNELIWQFKADESEDMPGTYNVTIDGDPLFDYINADWEDNVEIIVNVDGLPIGIYNVTIFVTDHNTSDQPELTAEDSATVMVHDGSGTVPTDTETSSSTSMMIGLGQQSYVDDNKITTQNDNPATTESSSSDAVFPFFAFLLALAIGIPILKIKDIRRSN